MSEVTEYTAVMCLRISLGTDRFHISINLWQTMIKSIFLGFEILNNLLSTLWNGHSFWNISILHALNNNRYNPLEYLINKWEKKYLKFSTIFLFYPIYMPNYFFSKSIDSPMNYLLTSDLKSYFEISDQILYADYNKSYLAIVYHSNPIEIYVWDSPIINNIPVCMNSYI